MYQMLPAVIDLSVMSWMLPPAVIDLSCNVSDVTSCNRPQCNVLDVTTSCNRPRL